ncbi:MAG: hypothetical protein E7212_02375 [Clostridium sartagoforme]|nr:hypothetical protein [Clostridium sartagoforme]
MFLKDDNNKEMLFLDEENLVYKRIFRKKIIKRKDIRSIFYDECNLGILTYSGKMYSFNIKKLLFTERRKLEELRLELNKENILFDYVNYRFNVTSLPVIWLGYMLTISINNIDKFLYQVLVVSIFIISIFVIKKVRPNIVYNIDKEEFEIIKFKNTIKYKKYEIDKIKVINVNNNIRAIEFKKSGNKYKMYIRQNPYLISIYNLSLIKLFN